MKWTYNRDDHYWRPRKQGVSMTDRQVWRIWPTSCRCGGRWAWFRQRPSGAWESMGCVCHSAYTLMMRL